MKQLSRDEKLRLQIGLALMTGMFMAVPVTYGAPVHDANSGISGALGSSAIKQTTANNGGVKTEITGNSSNNVVAWRDFSVGANDEVEFDGGKNTNNYLNVVTGMATSQIDGKITGGKEVYIVNPHGVIFGENAKVNVGALYVSTEDVASAVNAKANMGNNPSAVLAGTPNADVVNLGNIQANKVQVEGTNIRFLDSDKVHVTTNSNNKPNVVLNATGYAHVGNDAGTSAGYSGTNLTDDFKLIHNANELVNAATTVNGTQTVAAAPSKNYMLAADIDMSTLATGTGTNTIPYNFTPIGNSSATAYGGTFDGMFFEVRNLNVSTTNSDAGFFGNLNGANIYNLGIKNPNIVATVNNNTYLTTIYAGGIAGSSTGSYFTNVYVEGGSVTAPTYAGGLAGKFTTGTINSAYNTSKVTATGKGAISAGLVAYIGESSKETTINNAYNTGAADVGVYRSAYGHVYLNDIYMTGSKIAPNVPNNVTVTNSYYLNNGKVSLIPSTTAKGDATTMSSYANWDISNDGIGNHVWRIYEGTDTPILTAFLKGTATADYKFNYFADTTKTTATSNGLALAGITTGTSNNSSDISGTYNAQVLRITKSDGKTLGSASDINFSSNVDLTAKDSSGNALVTVDTSGIRNVKVDSVTNNAIKQSIISSTQHGYNIIGGGVTIEKRQVNVQGGTYHITKEYDGTPDADKALTQAMSGGSSGIGVSGLLANDDAYVDGLTATYASGSNVVTNDTVTVSASNLKMAGTSKDNYALNTGSLSNFKVTGDITPRTIYVKLKSTGSFDKTYDGNATVIATAADAANNIEVDTSHGTDHQFIGSDNISGISATIKYADKNAGNGKSITYSNITGGVTQNYRLVVENSNSTTGYDLLYDGFTQQSGTGTLTGAYGDIKRRVIDASTFQVQDGNGNPAKVWKTYDGNSSLSSIPSGFNLAAGTTTVADEGLVAGENISFALDTSQNANFVNANNNGQATSHVKEATNVDFYVTATAGADKNTNPAGLTLLSNYAFRDSNGVVKDLTATDSYSVRAEGEIKARPVGITISNLPASMDKVYDGSTAVDKTVYNQAYTFGGNGYVQYSSTATANQLVGNDTLTVTADYKGKNVVRDTNNNPTTQGIDFTVAVQNDVGDYMLYDATQTTTAPNPAQATSVGSLVLGASTTGAKGIIRPKNLSSSFADVTKEYDGNTSVPQPSANVLAGGIVSGDVVSLQSGYSASFHSPNVRGDAKGQNWVDYTNLALTGKDAGNYTIASTAKGVGIITAKTLQASDFQYTFSPTITKEYDGGTTLNNADLYLTGVVVKSTGDVIKGIVNNQSINRTSNVTGTFTDANSNSSNPQTINYTLTILDDGSGNFVVPAGGLTVPTTTQGAITPRTVVASIVTNPTKVYDALTTVVDSQGVAMTGDAIVKFSGLNGKAGIVGTDSNGSSAVYQDQSGNSAQDSYAGTKNVLYTAKINTGDQTNYNIINSSGQAVSSTNPLIGTGTISQRALTVTFNGTTKIYDGTDAVASSAISYILNDGSQSGSEIIARDKANKQLLDTTIITGQYTGRTNNADVGTNLDVSYGNLIQALGTHAVNYTIANTGAGKGEITTLTLTNSNFKFDFNTITKEYDGTQDVAYTDRKNNRVTAESFINGVTNAIPYVDINNDQTYTAGVDVQLQGYTATSAIYTNSADSNSSAQPVKYEIKLGNNLSNFNLSGLSSITTPSGAVLTYNSSTGLLEADTTGTITPRAVYASAGNYVPTKPYDGQTTIPQNIQSQVANNVILNGLLGTDGVKLNTAAINAAYGGTDAGTQSVTYNVELTGGNTGNYVLTGATGANYVAATDSQGNKLDTKGTLTGTGTISKAPLTISFGEVSKEYDGKDNVLSNAITATLSGFVNNESDALDATALGLIKGTYGTWDATNGVQGDANVNRQTPYVPNKTYGYKGVVYQNIDGALADYVQRNAQNNVSVVARNYYIDLDATAKKDTAGNTVAGKVTGTVADTLYFKEAAQKGYIKPLALTAGDIKERWVGPITKEYDGDAYVKNVNGSLNDYLKLEATMSPNGNSQTINVPYTVLASNATYNGGKDVSTSGQGVTYKLSGLTAQALGNFAIAQADADLFDISKSGSRATVNSTVTTYQATGSQSPATSITPKVIGTGMNQTTDIDKVYDGYDTENTGNAYYSVGDIVTADQGKVNVAVTGYYADKTNSNSHKTAASAMPGQGNDAYDVWYTFTLTDTSGNGGTSGNYTLASGSVQNTLTLTGTGDILKRAVYVGFKPGNDTGLDKYYDGDNSVEVAYKDASRFYLSKQSGDTGVLTAEQNIVQLANNINAAYQSPHVQRKSNGQVTTQDVIFSNFNLQGTTLGDGSGNYYLEPTDATGKVTLTGKGTIKPLSISVSIAQAPTKEYDGKTALTDGYEKKDNILINEANLIGTDTINYQVLSADYADKNVAEGTKGYTYQLRWDNSDYDLVAQPTAAGETMQLTGYAGGKVTGSLSGTNGTITPRILSVQSVADTEKEYDGTTGVENAAYNVKLNNRIISGDNIGLTVTAQYDSADAGASENSNELIAHAVNYKLNLSNGNYQLAQDTVQGKGTIRRKGLSVVAEPAAINAGEAMPKFIGSVTGFVNGERDNYTAFLNGLTYKTDAGVNTSNPGTYGVYGWYKGNKTGLVGRNYTFDQAVSNDSALTVNNVNNNNGNSDTPITPDNPVNPSDKETNKGGGNNGAEVIDNRDTDVNVIVMRNINNGNPDTKITPSNNVYKQISKDMNSGFGDTGAAAIEYKDKGGNIIATENINSGEINSSGMKMGFGGGDITDKSNQSKGTSHIGIVGGDIVNMEGADAAGSANIEVSSNGTTVNLEVFSIEDENNSAGRNAVAEITSVDGRQGTASIENKDAAESVSVAGTAEVDKSSIASIEITDKKQDILEEEAKDKTEENEKKGEIAIKSSNGENEDEIELKVEKDGVNVA